MWFSISSRECDYNFNTMGTVLILHTDTETNAEILFEGRKIV